MIDRELLRILACPVCLAALEHHAERLSCVGCGRRYPIVDDVPVLLVEAAEPPAAGWSPPVQ